jgi:hypothetical protein
MKNIIFCAVLALAFASCAQEGVTLEGALTLGSGGETDKMLLNHPVLLLSDSLVSRELAQRREGYKQELARVQAASKGIGSLLDSLQTAFKEKGDKKIEARYKAVADSGAALKKETEKSQRELFRSITAALAKKAVAGTNTDNTGKFKFEKLKPGTYILLTGYDAQKRSGLLLKQIELKSKMVVDLTYRDADAVLNFILED